MERNVVCALVLNNPLLLCALLVGWFFARELGFVLLCAVGLATIFTLGCKLLELLGVPISVNLTMLVEFFSLNSLLCIGVALAAAVAGRLCRGRQLEEEVRQVESEVIQRLEGQAELSKQEEILLGMARSRKGLFWMQSALAVGMLVMLWLGIFATPQVCSENVYSGVPQVVARLEEMKPVR